jgi:NAD(P)-dependent dehydrogenase (short-subunit alcohol dehydrogenase family)
MSENAGACHRHSVAANFLELSLQEWQLVQDVNSTGTFLMAQAVARHTVTSRPGGRTRAIVNIASIEGACVMASSGHPQVHYNASGSGQVGGRIPGRPPAPGPHSGRLSGSWLCPAPR